MKIHDNVLANIINGFNAVSLVAIDKVKLMDRVDQKFTVELSQAIQILKAAQAHYHILEVGGYRLSPYVSQYFDFENYQLFYDHHSKKANRYKIRHRHYVSSDLSFFEIKYKDNKGRTIKSRVEDVGNHCQMEDQNHKNFIEQKTGLETNLLKGVLDIHYQRLTLVNHDFTERVTLDFDLVFKDNLKTIPYGPVVVFEVKQSKMTKSPIIDLLRAKKIPSLGISKYCLAVISLKENIKYNGFKSKLRLIRKYTENNINL